MISYDDKATTTWEPSRKNGWMDGRTDAFLALGFPSRASCISRSRLFLAPRDCSRLGQRAQLSFRLPLSHELLRLDDPLRATNAETFAPCFFLTEASCRVTCSP